MREAGRPRPATRIIRSRPDGREVVGVGQPMATELPPVEAHEVRTGLGEAAGTDMATTWVECSFYVYNVVSPFSAPDVSFQFCETGRDVPKMIEGALSPSEARRLAAHLIYNADIAEAMQAERVATGEAVEIG